MDKKEIIEKFKIVEEPRHQSYIAHKLTDVLVIVMCAVIAGISELADMMEYFESKKGFFKEQFGIEKVPSKPTMSRILNMLDGEKIAPVIIEIMKESVVDTGGVIAVDGKAIRSTAKKDKNHSALQIITAYCTESGVVLGQSSISHEDKTNEIPIFQEMLDVIDVKGKTITADALHCQKETCKKIISKGGDYLFALKGNQATLFNDVKLYFESPLNETESSKTINKTGGRIEERTCFLTKDIAWLNGLKDWAGLKSILSIKRKTTTKNKVSEETSYYISSLYLPTEELMHTAREHWKIESMHWMLDVVWKEDNCRILSDNGNKTLNIFRKLALLAHKRFVSGLPKKKTVKSNVLRSLLDDSVLLEVLSCL